MISYDNNLQFYVILENIIYSKILLNNKTYKNIPIFKSNDFLSEYNKLSSIILLFSIYPGYEINLEFKLLNSIIKKLNNEILLDDNEIQIYQKSTTLNKLIFKIFIDNIQHSIFLINNNLNINNYSSKINVNYNNIVNKKSETAIVIIEDNNFYKLYKNKNNQIFEINGLLLAEQIINKNFEIVKLLKFDLNNNINQIELINLKNYIEYSNNNKIPTTNSIT